MIAIVDTGGANHTSVQDALLRLGAESRLTVEPETIKSASHVILPGVGHAAYAMERLRQHRLTELIHQLQQPVLGICLGMHILFEASDEGDAKGLGLIEGRVKRIEAQPDFRVPHMGWNQLAPARRTCPLLNEVDENTYFYFVHSYRVPSGPAIVSETRAPNPLPSILHFRNYYATQFHPERSSRQGAQLLKNFLTLGHHQ